MKVLIIGGGIAGTTLAQLCEDKGIDFRVVEKGTNECSQMAAGILNPMVFRRMNLSWRVEEMMPAARSFYRKMEQKLGQEFYREIPIRRLLASDQEAGYWIKKQHLPVYADFMKEQTAEDLDFPTTKNTFGTGVLKGSACVNAMAYIPAQWKWLSETGRLDREAFDYQELDPETADYKGETFDYIIFAQGKDMLNNPWFRYLPLEATKGELLTIKAPAVSQAESLNRKCFMLPLGNGEFRVGSTYDFGADNTVITEEGKRTIMEQLTSVTDEPYTVTDQQAGVRPTVKDRRPLLGKHPDFPKLVIANGLGTKGYMLAPLLMEELLGHLAEGKPLDPETEIARYDSLKNLTD